MLENETKHFLNEIINNIESGNTEKALDLYLELYSKKNHLNCKKSHAVIKYKKFLFERIILLKYTKNQKVNDLVKEMYFSFFTDDVKFENIKIFFSSMPKSGSTLSANIASTLLNAKLYQANNANQLDIYFDFNSIKSLVADSVLHNHISASPEVICFLKITEMSVIFNYRNIFDSLESIASHVSNEMASKFLLGNNYKNLSVNEIEQYVVFKYYLKNIELYVSWMRAQRWIEVNSLFFTKDDAKIIENAKKISKIAEKVLGEEGLFEKNKLRIDEILKNGELTRHRKRSVYLKISDEKRQSLKEIANFYKDVDTSPLFK